MNTWKDVLYDETRKDYYQRMVKYLKDLRKYKQIYPADDKVFNAFKLTPLDKVQVVIVGQDPYHGPGQANGLAFSVNPGVSIPPSLRNIFKEVRTDISKEFNPEHGDLTSWAKQGVLLLNTYLTVEKGAPESHNRIGWEKFTKAVITALDDSLGDDVVYLLWGSHARSIGPFIENGKIFASAHPSPMANGFLGCGHFSKANEYLLRKGREGIDWSAL